MRFLRAMAQFVGPWLAFALVSGGMSAFALGLGASVIGLIIGIVTLLNDLSLGMGFHSLTPIVQRFPDFALIVLYATGCGFAGGFFPALLAALVSGKTGFWWGIWWGLSAFWVGFFLISSTYAARQGDFIFDSPFFFFILATSFLGMAYSHGILAPRKKAPRFTEPLRPYFQTSWLANPSRGARFAGVFLPFFFYISWQIVTVAPTFQQNQHYMARFGFWVTWQNSSGLVFDRHEGRRSSCHSNLIWIGLAVKQYMQDDDEFMPPAPKSADTGAGAIMQPYLKSTAVFQCPQDFYSYGGGDFNSGDFTDYWFNSRLYSTPESSFTYISNTIMAGDGNTGAGEGKADYSLSKLPMPFLPATRHRGGANYAFADGHVKWLKPLVVSNTPPTSSSFSMLPQ